MNRLLVFLFLPIVFLSSCNAQGESSEKSTDLAKEVSALKEEVAFMKKALKYRGVDFDKIRSEMDAETKVHDIPLADSPVQGDPNAPITIVEFSDFQCPYCARVAPTVAKLVKDNPGKIKLVYKHFPLSFHKQAKSAHAAAMAAGKQGKFFEFRYAIAPEFRNLNKATYMKIAKTIGLDLVKFEKDLVLDAEKQDIIRRDIALGSKIGVRGTPSFYVNGKKVARFSPAYVEELIKKL